MTAGFCAVFGVKIRLFDQLGFGIFGLFEPQGTI
jgi:hypothetical protein